MAQDRSASQAVERIPSRGALGPRRLVRSAGEHNPSPSPRSTVPYVPSSTASACPAPTAIALFRESTVAGHFVAIAGVDGLASHVQLKTGRLPHRCTPARCEVLRLRGTGELPNAPGLRLVQVGTGSLRSRQLFGDFLPPTDNALADREISPSIQQRRSLYHRPPPAPLVVADGIVPLTVAPALSRTYRSYAWVWPLRAGAPRLWRIDDLVARTGPRARCALRQVDRVQRAGAAGGAACRRTRRDRGGAPAPPRRRRGGSVALRVRRARGSDDAARPAGGPPQAHLVRGAGLAARPVDGNRELCRRGHRYARRLGHRSCGRGDRGFDCRSAGRHRSARERAVPGRARGSWPPEPLSRPSSSRSQSRSEFARTRVSVRSTPRPRQRSRSSSQHFSAAPRTSRPRLASGQGAGLRPPAVTRADLVCRRRRGRSCLRPARQACRAAGPWSCRHEARCRHARARAGSGGCHSGVSRPRVCSGAPRRGLQGDARAGRRGSGSVSGAARRRRAGGPEPPRPRARCSPARAVRRARRRRRRPTGAAHRQQRRPGGGNHGRHRARPSALLDSEAARVAQRLRRQLTLRARLRGEPPAHG